MNVKVQEGIQFLHDVTQQVKFSWKRESGVEINIIFDKWNVIQKFYDDDAKDVYEGDTKGVPEQGNKVYVQNSSIFNSEEKFNFKLFSDKFCRHPVPDYYSLTLEITRDRTTNSTVIRCDSSNPHLPSCPIPLQDGDHYLVRSLNEPCFKEGTYPEVLHSGKNNIVTTEFHPLLSYIFNLNYTKVLPISFPPDSCESSRHRCNQCLETPICHKSSNEKQEKKCCFSHCYTLSDCKASLSSLCSHLPVECSMGDTYRYTLQPVFQNLDSEFQCYLKRDKNPVMFKIRYFLKIPTIGYVSPTVVRSIPADDWMKQSFGKTKVDFLDLEYNTTLKLADDILLVGKKVTQNSFSASFKQPTIKLFNFTLFPFLSKKEENQKSEIELQRVSPNIHVAYFDFERPFIFTSSRWNLEKASKPLYLNKFHTIRNRKEWKGKQKVKVSLQNSQLPFTYYLTSTDNIPYIRASIPAGSSVFSSFFEKNSIFIFNKTSPRIQMRQNLLGRVWEILVEGRMSQLNSFLSLKLINRQTNLLLLNQNFLISFPQTFNFTIKIPNWNHKVGTSFDLILSDSRTSHLIHLTFFSQIPNNLETNDDAVFEFQKFKPSKIKIQNNKFDSTRKFIFIFFILILILFFLVTIVLASSNFFHRMKWQDLKAGSIHNFKLEVNSNSFQDGNERQTHTSFPQNFYKLGNGTDPIKKNCLTSNHLSSKEPWCCLKTSEGFQKKKRHFGILLWLVWIHMSFLTTFFSFLFINNYFAFHDLMELKKSLKNVQLTPSQPNPFFDFIPMRKNSEIMYTQYSACSNHIEDLLGKIFDATQEYKPNNKMNPEHEMTANLTKEIGHLIKLMVGEVESGIIRSLKTYKKVLEQILVSEWFTVPLVIFNETFLNGEERERLKIKMNQLNKKQYYFMTSSQYNLKDYYFNSKTNYNKKKILKIFKEIEYKFGLFLEIEEVVFVESWVSNFYHKMKRLERVPHLPEPLPDSRCLRGILPSRPKDTLKTLQISTPFHSHLYSQSKPYFMFQDLKKVFPQFNSTKKQIKKTTHFYTKHNLQISRYVNTNNKSGFEIKKEGRKIENKTPRHLFPFLFFPLVALVISDLLILIRKVIIFKIWSGRIFLRFHSKKLWLPDHENSSFVKKETRKIKESQVLFNRFLLQQFWFVFTLVLLFLAFSLFSILFVKEFKYVIDDLPNVQKDGEVLREFQSLLFQNPFSSHQKSFEEALLNDDLENMQMFTNVLNQEKKLLDELENNFEENEKKTKGFPEVHLVPCHFDMRKIKENIVFSDPLEPLDRVAEVVERTEGFLFKILITTLSICCFYFFFLTIFAILNCLSAQSDVSSKQNLNTGQKSLTPNNFSNHIQETPYLNLYKKTLKKNFSNNLANNEVLPDPQTLQTPTFSIQRFSETKV